MIGEIPIGGGRSQSAYTPGPVVGTRYDRVTPGSFTTTECTTSQAVGLPAFAKSRVAMRNPALMGGARTRFVATLRRQLRVRWTYKSVTWADGGGYLRGARGGAARGLRGPCPEGDDAQARRGTQDLVAHPSATLSHMKIGVRDLRNRTGQVIEAVRAGERVVLTVHGEEVADIVPHVQRSRFVPGDLLRRELGQRAADPGLRDELDALAGQTLDEF